MAELRVQLRKLIESESKVLKDNTYLLPDRRILIKQGDKYVLIGHRSKKKIKSFLKLSLKQLRAKALLAGYSDKEVKNYGKHELVRLIYKRPRQIFHSSWLDSNAPAAMYLKKLIEGAIIYKPRKEK